MALCLGRSDRSRISCSPTRPAALCVSVPRLLPACARPGQIQVIARADQHRNPEGGDPLDEGQLALPLVGGRIPVPVVEEGFTEGIGDPQDIPAPEAADVDGGQLGPDQGVCRGAGKEGVAVGVQAEQVDRAVFRQRGSLARLTEAK